MTARLLNLLVILAVIAVNALANILPINEVTTGEVSAAYDNFFTPAGYTFSIWSVIYLSLLAYGVYQIPKGQKLDERVMPWLALNGLGNMSWIIAWHYEQLVLTLLFMVVILYSLIKLNEQIEQGNWVIKLPFRIYLGWICVATIANIAVVLTAANWNGLGIPEGLWGIIMVIIAGALAGYIALKKGWVLTAMAIAWGIGGLYIKQVNLERAELYQMVCLTMIAVISAISVYQAFYPSLQRAEA